MGQNWGLAMSDVEKAVAKFSKWALAVYIFCQCQLCFYGYQTGKIQVQGEFGT